MNNPQVIVDFVANTEGLNRGLSKAGDGAQGLGGKLKGMAKGAVIAAGAAGLAALGATLKIGIDEFSDSAKVAAQTQAVIKSTGGAAGVTAKQVGKLATALMTKSGVDDESIQSGENLLLTFRNIQNQTGKGNDIFTRATKTMLDMSVALGEDTSSAAMQLGKALNDPIKGVTALQRVGVTFTDGQKDQIKALTESGHTMEAQKIILGELNKEFGGSAEAVGKTLPGQINILKESFKNLAGEIVGALAPAFQTIATFFVENPGLAKALTFAVLGLAAAMVVLNAALAVSAALTAPYTLTILAVVAAIGAFIAIIVLLIKNWNKVTGVLEDGFDAIKKAALAVFNWLKSNWPLILGILSGPIGTAVALIITHWTAVKNATSDAFDAIKNVVSNVWASVSKIISNAVDAVSDNVTGAWNAIKKATSNVWGDIKSAISTPIGAIRDIVFDGVHAIQDNFSAAWNAIKTVTSTIWGDIRGVVSSVIDAAKGIVQGFASFLSGIANGPIAAALHGIQNVFHWIADGARDAVGAVKGVINGMIGWLWRIVNDVKNVAGAIAGAIKAPINAVLSAWNGIHIPGFGINIKMPGPVPDIHFNWGGIGLPNIPLLAKGAVVDSPTLAVVGEKGRELVTPEALLRQMLAEQTPSVRVYIGETELTDIVRTQVDHAGTSLARSLIAGGVG
jgi:hypothetical protein